MLRPLDFAFNPTNGPARIIRYVEPGTLLDMDTLSLYDDSNNLLIVDKHLFSLFSLLGTLDQHMVLRTMIPCLEIVYRPGLTPTFRDVRDARDACVRK